MSNQNGQNPENQENGNNELSFYSEEVQEVLSRTPGWMERSGNIMLLLLLLLGILLACVITYPDSIQVEAELLPAKPALIVMPAQRILVDQVLVADGSSVSLGTILLRGRDSTGSQSLMTASDSGTLQYLSQVNAGETVEAGTALFAITYPALAPQVKLYLNEGLNNRIRLGQKVLVSGDFMQRSGASLRGTVVRKSVSMNNGSYEVGVRLDEACEPVLNPQPVSASIILKDRRLIQRIFHM